MIGAGDLDRRITLQRAAAVPNEFNEPVETWSDLKTVWAGRKDVSDGERFAAGGIGGFLSARFVVRWSALTRGLLSSDRIIHDGRVWNIVGIKEVGERRTFIEITATAGAN